MLFLITAFVSSITTVRNLTIMLFILDFKCPDVYLSHLIPFLQIMKCMNTYANIAAIISITKLQTHMSHNISLCLSVCLSICLIALHDNIT